MRFGYDGILVVVLEGLLWAGVGEERLICLGSAILGKAGGGVCR